MRVLYLGVVLCFIAVCSANSCGSSELNLFGTPNDELPFNPSALGHHWRRTNPEASNLLPPLVLIPGLTGSGLQSKLTNAKLPILCNKNQDWARIWIEPLRLARVDCFTQTLMLSYDPATKTYSNTQGVSIDAIDFGGIEGVNYLAYNGDNQPVNQTDYFQPLISYLTGAGFIVGETLYAAPYDWRLTTNPNGWNDKFKTLVETAYTNSGNKKVFTLCHSMGNLEFASFMQTMTTEWKEKYIGGFISAAAPWSGASVALRALISGFEFKVGPITVDPLVIANVARTFGSVVWMLPDQYLRGTDPIVTVNSTTYNYLQFNSIFNQLGATETREIYTDMLGTLAFLPAPGVPTYCLYGTNKPTELWYEYNNGLNNQPTAIHCDPSGDGVVPLASLQKCLSMNPVSSRTFNLVSHGDLVKDPLFFNEVMRIVSPIPAK